MNEQPITCVKESYEDYDSHKDCISSYDIKNFLKSPLLYYSIKYNKMPTHTKFNLNLQNALLLPDDFKENYVVMPKFDKRTKDGRAGFDLFELENEGKTTIDKEELELINNMVKSLAENTFKSAYYDLIKDSVSGNSYYTIDEKTNLKLKFRPDGGALHETTLIDLKSCVEASSEKFRSDALQYGYDVSASLYLDFLNKKNYLFYYFDKLQPYQVSIFEFDEPTINWGREKYRMALDLIKWCTDNDFWCDYDTFLNLKHCYRNLPNFTIEDVKSKPTEITLVWNLD